MDIARYEKRLGAYLIDKGISWIFLVVFLILFWLFLPRDFSLFLSFLLATGLSIILHCLLLFLSLFFTHGSSLGIWLFHIRIVHPDLSILSPKESFIRSLIASFLVVAIAEASFMLIRHTERSVADRLTNTIAVNMRQF